VETRTVEKLGALAAIIAGGLRIADDFLPALHATAITLDWAYFITDAFLLLGAVTLFARNAARIGLAGLAGFSFSLSGSCSCAARKSARRSAAIRRLPRFR
jgi:hypothetical protein